jgi:hypothetical protein
MNVFDFQTASGKSHADTSTDVAKKKSVSLAQFKGFDDDGRFLVALNQSTETQYALSTIGLSNRDIGTDVAVAYINDDEGTPIIIGRIQHANGSGQNLAVKLDGERIVLHADRDIELRCGNASIVLTRTGKVLIKGNYVLTRSSGANKIKGAYVDIN